MPKYLIGFLIRMVSKLLASELPDTLIMNIAENTIKLAVGVVF